ncbi:MAG: 2-dehydropantoate 2-reductase N-terminal domain-containing protein [Candidatus Sulfotelmatobacter sp.]
MKVLVYGAGVIGTLYASRLQDGGHQVTILARDSRLADIRRHGLVLEDVMSDSRSTTQVNVAERLSPEDRYDMALIAVRWDQLSGILPELAANRTTPTILFMLNNPGGSTGLTDALGTDRVLLGFPGVGGTLQGHVVRYIRIPQQPTTLGEPNGSRSTRLQEVVETFRASGLRTRIDSDMNAWLISHAFFVTAVGGAIYVAEGDCARLSHSPAILNLMVSGVREGFDAVRALGRPVHPFALRVLFSWLPRSCAASYWRRFFSKREAEYIFAGHVRRASKEMQSLAVECRLLLSQSSVVAPALTQLYRAIDEYAAIRVRR